jgi:hypothetical protein
VNPARSAAGGEYILAITEMFSDSPIPIDRIANRLTAARRVY